MEHEAGARCGCAAAEGSLDSVELVAGAPEAPEAADFRDARIPRLLGALDQVAAVFLVPEEGRFGVGFLAELGEREPEFRYSQAREVLEDSSRLDGPGKAHEKPQRPERRSLRLACVGEDEAIGAERFDASLAQRAVRAARGDGVARALAEHLRDMDIAPVAAPEQGADLAPLQVDDVHARRSTSAS